MRTKQFLLNSTSGFTIIELMVSIVIGLIMVATCISTVLASRDSYQSNLIRTRINQNVRGAFDIIGVNIKQAGERLPGNVPAIEVINGTDGASDQLVIRRNLLGEVLKLCQDLNGNSNQPLTFGDNSTTTGCDYDSQIPKFDAWKNMRLSNDKVFGYIINPITNESEVFEYVSEQQTPTRLRIRRAPGTGNWQNSYTVGQTRVYLIEEWHFSLQPDPLTSSGKLLTLIANGQGSDPLYLAYGITDLQISVNLKDGTTVDHFAPTESWSEIKNIEIEVSSEDSYKERIVKSDLKASFFPRNIISLS